MCICGHVERLADGAVDKNGAGLVLQLLVRWAWTEWFRVSLRMVEEASWPAL